MIRGESKAEAIMSLMTEPIVSMLLVRQTNPDTMREGTIPKWEYQKVELIGATM